MTLTNKEVAKVLFKAYRYKKPIDFISENYQLNEEEAYHVQEELIDQLTFKDRSTVTGYKVSMTSKATQAIANTNEPAYGTLLSNQIVNDGASVSLSELFSPTTTSPVAVLSDIKSDKVKFGNQFLYLASGISMPGAIRV